MVLLTLERACLAFGHVPLLDAAALQVDSGERIALIGRNGCGKSSLLRVVAGESTLDDGNVWRHPGLRIAYVPQENQFAPTMSVFDAVALGLGDASALLVAYHAAAARVAHDASEGALAELHDLQQRVEACDAWRGNHRIEQVLSQAGLDGDASLATLSGGGIKRVALARALVAEPDLLLLDEPTNHLDIDAIVWLEELLAGFAGAAIVISHDRAFVDRVATRIVELDRGRLTSFPEGFAAYRRRKEQLLVEEARQSAQFDRLLAQEEAWIRQGVEARRTRSVGRVRRLEELRRERAARRERQGNVSLEIARGAESGRIVAELTDVAKSFGGRPVVRGLSCRIQRGDKFGIIGPNGAGKTTLLRLLLGELPVDSGEVRLGSRLEIAYYDQFRNTLDEQATLADVISPGSDFVEINGAKKHVVSYLGDFLFAPERARSPVRSLSGGERNRLLLARLFARPVNVLVLDEPTNDLDLETLELLEALLQEFQGTLFLVSHDREFLDNVVTQSLIAEGEGRWREYVGGYSDWLRQRALAQPAVPAPPVGSREPEKVSARNVRDAAKLSYRETKELAALTERIAALEAEQALLHGRLADPALYAQAAEAARCSGRLRILEEELGAAMLRWEALESRA